MDDKIITDDINFEKVRAKALTIANNIIMAVIVLLSMGIGFSVAVSLMRRGIIE